MKWYKNKFFSVKYIIFLILFFIVSVFMIGDRYNVKIIKLAKIRVIEKNTNIIEGFNLME